MKNTTLKELMGDIAIQHTKPIRIVSMLMADGSWKPKEDFYMHPTDNDIYILIKDRYFMGGDDVVIGMSRYGTSQVYRGKWNDGGMPR